MYSLANTVPANDKRQEEWAAQREARGFDDTELWNLDNTIIKFSLPRIKAFRENHMGFPATLQNDEEWIKILDKIINAFEDYLDNDNIDEEGFMLFGKYLPNLWD